MRNVTGIPILIISLALAIVGCTRTGEPVPAAPASASAPATSSQDVSRACTPPGEQATIATLTPIGQPCGAVVCGPGLHCCNASCSHCTARGVECTQQSCN